MCHGLILLLLLMGYRQMHSTTKGSTHRFANFGSVLEG